MYLPFARRQIAKMRALGLDYLSKHLQIGSVNISLRIEPGHDHIRIEDADPARLVWAPEGIFFTPRTTAAPRGYGLPKTEDGFGTPAGPLRFVMVNRLKHNGYPEYLRMVWKLIEKDKELPERDAKWKKNLAVWPLFYTKTDGDEFLPLPDDAPPGTKPKKNLYRVGLTHKGDVKPQFGEWLVPMVMEPRDAENWYCHRPVTVRYESSIGTDVLNMTNAFRVSQGRRPCIPPVRGFTTSMAALAVREVASTGVLRHDSTKFREGYRSTVERSYLRAGDLSGENLAIANATEDKTLQEVLVESWVDSPRHAEVMATDYETPFEPSGGADLVDESDPGSAACVLDFSVKGGSVNETYASGYEEGSPSKEIDPPVSGAIAAQVFVPFSHPLVGASVVNSYYGPISFGGEARKTDSSSMDCYRPIKPFRRYVDDDKRKKAQTFIFFKGRRVHFEYPGGTKLPDGIESVECIAVTAVTKDNEPYLRMLLKYREVDAGGLGYVLFVEGKFNGFYESRRTISRFDFPADADKYSVGRFSESGERAVFSYTTLSRYTGLVVKQTGLDWGSHVAQDDEAEREKTFGQVVNFCQFLPDGTQTYISDHLDVLVPTCSGVEDGHQFSSTCVGSCKLFATYQGESLGYAYIHVDCAISKSNLDPWSVRLRGEIEFPDGSVLVYTDTTSDNDYLQTTGDATIIHYLDIDKPEHTVYERMRFGKMGDETAPPVNAVMKVRAWLMLGVNDPRVLHLDSLDVDDLTPGYSTESAYRPEFWGQRAGGIPVLYPYRFWANLLTTHSSCQNSHPVATYKATVAQSIDYSLGAREEYTDNSVVPNPAWLGPVHQAHVGPVIEFDKELSSTRFVRIVAWGGELIVCGGFREHFSSYDAAPVVSGDRRFFVYSTLNLGEISGLGTLLNDISPIGAL